MWEVVVCFIYDFVFIEFGVMCVVRILFYRWIDFVILFLEYDIRYGNIRLG